MFWHWVLLLIIVVVGNFLCLGSMLIGFANSPAVLISGADIKFRGTARYTLGAIVAFLFQSIAAITLSALIINYTRYITSDSGKNVFIWIVGTVGAIYPMWQTWSLARRERLTEPESYIVKEATHKAVPYSLLIAVVFTLLFVFKPIVLDALFYWLLVVATLVSIGSVISMVLLAQQQLSNRKKQLEVENLELEIEQTEQELAIANRERVKAKKDFEHTVLNLMRENPASAEAVLEDYKEKPLEEGTTERYERDALVAWKRGDRETALHLYNEAIDIDSDNAVALLNRGNLQIELGNFDEGINDLERASELDPKLPTHNATLFKDMPPEMRESVRQRMLEKLND
jgi:tetratricopeptide (TPR) repeat protein